MLDLLLPYLVAVVAFVVVIVIALASHHFAERTRRAYEDKQRQLPDFLRYTDFRAELDELELRIADLREEAAHAEALIAEAETKRQWLADNESAIRQAEQARRDLEVIESKLTSAIEQLAAKEEELRKVQEERNKAEFEVKRFAEQALTEQDMRDRAVRERGELLKQLADASTRLDQARKEVVDREREVAVLTKERDGLVTERAGLQREIEELRQKQSALEKAVKDLGTSERRLQNAVAALEGRDAALQAKIRETVGGAAQVDDPLDELRKPVLRADAFLERELPEEETSALDSLAKSLANEGLQFHRRVLDAFHTALKTQSESPLLVLAGISGTGKSLLPQRYAEHMGIHSLLVPVQPRWDGPQDLLGFFNYLEGRYKPTELIRALVQFDPYLDLSEDPSDRLDERLLLVVLDEMNLARVEYYFSEFLSRLEARRELRSSTPDARRRASLTVEMGASESGATEQHVFVDQNVLFVGTINEDESTQTLSDKVVDRANVLRFGRPTQIRDPRAGPPDKKSRRQRRPFLSVARWRHWIDSSPELDAQQQRNVLEHIEELNNALQKIGKPFGYRTRNAILAYARHYPARTPDRLKLAIADQIEQRVLPKLRGIDPSENQASDAIRMVQDVVETLGDRELGDAIDFGKTGGHGHTFLWQGVDRTSDRS